MNAPAQLFLRAKHWQLFLPSFAYGLLGDVLIVYVTTKVANSTAALQVSAIANAVVTVPFMIAVLLWYWSVGSFLYSIAPPTLRPNIGFFRFALIFPPIYMFAFFMIVLKIGSPLLVLVLPLHFFAMYCLLYNLYFLSKSLRLVEKRQPVSFSDYAGAFLLFWFFPIGVWFIQPKINRLYGKLRPTPWLDIATAG